MWRVFLCNVPGWILWKSLWKRQRLDATEIEFERPRQIVENGLGNLQSYDNKWFKAVAKVLRRPSLSESRYINRR
jgi:hypothetical protein